MATGIHQQVLISIAVLAKAVLANALQLLLLGHKTLIISRKLSVTKMSGEEFSIVFAECFIKNITFGPLRLRLPRLSPSLLITDVVKVTAASRVPPHYWDSFFLVRFFCA